MLKWFGAILILLSCGGYGFSMALEYRKREQNLHQMIHMISFMESELQCHLTPLPELCRKAAHESKGSLRQVMKQFAAELDAQHFPDVCSCMSAVIQNNRDITTSFYPVLLQLGKSLGRFDLPGQIRGLEMIQRSCQQELEKLSDNSDTKRRNYQTLGLCAGAALAILFI